MQLALVKGSRSTRIVLLARGDSELATLGKIVGLILERFLLLLERSKELGDDDLIFGRSHWVWKGEGSREEARIL